MTRDIAIEVLTDLQDGSAGECWLAETIADAIDRKIEDLHDALAMAIEALQTPPISQRSMYQAGYRQGREEALKGKQLDEWCYSCKEYDTEKKCCPRFNKVIREALKREPSEDGTLEVKVEDATKVGRVLISDDKHRGGLYYPDEDELQGDLISRQAAIDALYDKGSSMTAWGELLAMKWSDIQKCIEQLPSADRPTDEFDGMIFSADKYMAFIDKKEIHIMRKGAHKVTVERMFNTEEDEE